MRNYYVAEEQLACGPEGYIRRMLILHTYPSGRHGAMAPFSPTAGMTVRLLSQSPRYAMARARHAPRLDRTPSRHATSTSINADALHQGEGGPTGPASGAESDRSASPRHYRLENPSPSRRATEGRRRVTPRHQDPAKRRQRPTRDSFATAQRDEKTVWQRPLGAEFGLVFRKAFPEPGLFYRLPFGWFAPEIESQLAAPQRLGPMQRIDCLLQIYQIYRPVRTEQMALAETGSAERAGEFHHLTPRKAHQLGLPQFACRQTGDPRIWSRKSPAPGQVFRLQVVSDPTISDNTEPGAESGVLFATPPDSSGGGDNPYPN